MDKPVIGILLGDPSGVGPEIVAKAAQAGVLTENTRPLLIGDEWMLKSGIETAGVTIKYDVLSLSELPEDGALNLENGRLTLLNIGCMTPPAVFGKLDAACGGAVVEMIKASVELAKKKQIDGICFAPFNKAAIKLSGRDAESELRLFQECFGIDGNPSEINVADGLFTTRVTSHIPLMEVGAHLTQEAILESVRRLHSVLLRSGQTKPAIALCALNPHGGESGMCGREEVDVIIPACEAAMKENLGVMGVFPADTVFVNAFTRGAYNGVVTMFHDQGQIALKLRNFTGAVTLEEGLPVPIGTPAHGTAFDIAGKNLADPNPFNTAYRIITNLSAGRS